MSSKRKLSELVGKPSSSELFTLGIPREFHTPILGMYEGGEAERFNAITNLAEKHLELKPHNAALEYLASRALHEENPRLRLEAVRSLADLAARSHEASETLGRLKVELKKQDARYKDHLLGEIKEVRAGGEPPTIERSENLNPAGDEAHGSAAIASYAREALGNPHERIRSAALERLEDALKQDRGEALKGLLKLKDGLEKHAPKDEAATQELLSVQRLLERAGVNLAVEKALWVSKSSEYGVSARREGILRTIELLSRGSAPAGIRNTAKAAFRKYARDKEMRDNLFRRARQNLSPEAREELYKTALKPLWRTGSQNVSDEEYAHAIELERELRKALAEQGKAKPLVPKRKPIKRPVEKKQGEAVPVFEGSVKEQLDAIDAAAREGSNEHLPALFHALSNESDSVRHRVIGHLIHWRRPEIERLLIVAAFNAGETPHGDALRYVQKQRRKNNSNS